LSTVRRRILVVSDTLALANNLLTWLKDAGYDTAVVSTFSAGKEHLRTVPDVLITELKLREYNGLHLALRAHRDGIPAAVIGADARHAGDAQELGASYVIGDNVHRDDILLLVDGLLSARATRFGPSIEWKINGESEREQMPSSGDGWQASDDQLNALAASAVRPVIH
jgi:DNA-binding response OmpR family regulator